MIFFVATLMVGFAIWLALRSPATEPTVGHRLAEATFPIAVCIALIAVAFALLSLRWIGQDLNQATIGKLRALEAGIPGWAKYMAEVLPKWYHNAVLALIALGVAVYRARASAAELAALDRQQRVIARLRAAGNWATGISCALFAASALTLFGDSLKDIDGDIRAELHEAELRFSDGTDVAIRQFSNEVVQQSVSALQTYQPPSSASWNATRDALNRPGFRGGQLS
jgi:hypothetical protein